ncbi:ArsR/SmtB family transcription factor [Trinickia fusca]|uniref:Transcriptional regulator n=1 Tax=Trinickia fusca TaxID=2419777 RepID=A0A494X3I1_9BURK|nr:helix-turn-helix transcriptional regulator [Trinickia fusca]RKP45255.1 transcriptional regulator [Trinickia fusca]
MNQDHNVASVAFLIADPARAAMLMFLGDGRARAAGELAHVAGVTAQTASSHLSKLLAGGLLAVESMGRHRFYRLAGAEVAAVLEKLAAISPNKLVNPKHASRALQDLRFARCCYDHLAGRLGVAVTRAMQERDLIVAMPEQRYGITAAGVDWFRQIGLDALHLDDCGIHLASQCLDSTERRHHLAGPLGKHFMSTLFSKGWLHRRERSRAISVTPDGWSGLKALLNLDEQSLRLSDWECEVDA